MEKKLVKTRIKRVTLTVENDLGQSMNVDLTDTILEFLKNTSMNFKIN